MNMFFPQRSESVKS